MAKSDAAMREIAAAAAAAPAAEQLDLMPPGRESMTTGEQERFDRAVAHGKAGRPPGATNLANRQMLDFIRRTLGDPMLDSARWATHTPESLALVLGCTKAEAFDRIEKIRADLRPYFYAKQAPVDGAGKVVPGLTMQVVAQGAVTIGADGLQRPPWLYQEPDEQNQALKDVSPGASDGSVDGDAD